MMKTPSENLIRQNLYFQLFFWTALFLFGTARMYGEYNEGAFKEVIIYNFCHWIFQIAGANFIYFILIHHFFDRKKYLEFVLSLLLSLYVISVINRFFIVYLAEPLFTNEVKDSIFNIATDIPYLLLHYTSHYQRGIYLYLNHVYHPV